MVTAVLAAFTCLNVLMRLPSVPHEFGVDSFFIHTISESINHNHRAPWILNPLSYFGLYPLSYPSAGPFLYSGMSQTLGLSIETAILALGILLGATSVPLSFMMARALRRDPVLGLVVALAFSIAPRFLTFTMWTGATRGIFMFFFVGFLWALLAAYRRPTVTTISLLLLMLGLAAVTHRLAVLILLVLFALVLTYIVLLALSILRRVSPRTMLSPRLRRYASFLSLLVLVAVALTMLLGTDVLKEYEGSSITGGGSTLSQFVALGGSIGRSVGLALPFALVGVAYLPFLRNKALPEALVLFTLIVLIPTLFLRRYTGIYITPLIALFAGLGVLYLVRLLRTRRQLAAVAVAGCLVAMGAVALVARDFELRLTPYMEPDAYSAGLYLRHLPGSGTPISNHGLYGVQVASISGKPYLPVGGNGTAFQSPELLAFSYFTAQDVYNNTVRIPLQNLTPEDDSPFYLYGIQAEEDWAVILQDFNYPRVSILDQNRYRLTYYLEDEFLGENFTAYDNIYASIFARSVKDGFLEAGTRHEARYQMVDFGPGTLWMVYPHRAYR